MTTTTDEGHPGLWWQDGDVADENPDVRAKYAEEFDRIPKQRIYIPTRDEILRRGNRG